MGQKHINIRLNDQTVKTNRHSDQHKYNLSIKTN